MENDKALQAVEVHLPMTAETVRQHVNLIQRIMREVMKDGEHYGTIPGCGDKKVLHKSGAEMLRLAFHFVPTFDIRRVELKDGHREYEIVCRLTDSRGNLIAEGVGACSSMETKYRYRTERLCPKCGADAIVKGKPEFGGGYLCFTKRGGCGAKFKTTDPAMKETRAENPNIADCYNTVLKMAKKRAFVDATITSTSTSDIFTQDLEETAEVETPTKAPVEAKTEDDQPEVISEAQRKFLFVQAKIAGLDHEGIKQLLKDVLGVDSTKAITVVDFQRVLDEIEVMKAIKPTPPTEPPTEETPIKPVAPLTTEGEG